MSDYTRYGAMDEELKKMLNSSRNDFEAEREARIKAENDIRAVQHDRELQEKQIKELQDDLKEEKRKNICVVIAGAKMAAKCDAVEAARDSYKNAFEAAIGVAFGEDDDDDD